MVKRCRQCGRILGAGEGIIISALFKESIQFCSSGCVHKFRGENPGVLEEIEAAAAKETAVKKTVEKSVFRTYLIAFVAFLLGIPLVIGIGFLLVWLEII